MKRLMFLALATALIVGVWASTTTSSVSAAGKTPVCHFDNGGDFGHIIQVTDSALPAHLAHGDLLFFVTGEDGETCSAPLQ